MDFGSWSCFLTNREDQWILNLVGSPFLDCRVLVLPIFNLKMIHIHFRSIRLFIMHGWTNNLVSLVRVELQCIIFHLFSISRPMTSNPIHLQQKGSSHIESGANGVLTWKINLVGITSNSFQHFEWAICPWHYLGIFSLRKLISLLGRIHTRSHGSNRNYFLPLFFFLVYISVHSSIFMLACSCKDITNSAFFLPSRLVYSSKLKKQVQRRQNIEPIDNLERCKLGSRMHRSIIRKFTWGKQYSQVLIFFFFWLWHTRE